MENMCVSQLFFTVTKILDKNNLEEEKSFLAHGFNPWLTNSIALGLR